MNRWFSAASLALILACGGGGGGGVAGASSPQVGVSWSQATLTMPVNGSASPQVNISTTGGIAPIEVVNLTDVDANIPGGPTHGNGPFQNNNCAGGCGITIPFQAGSTRGTWRYEARVNTGGGSYASVLSITVQ